MTLEEQRLHLWSDDPDESRQTDELHADALIDDQAKSPDDLVDRCNAIERGVHPALLADTLSEYGNMPSDRVLKNTRLFYFRTHMALLHAARIVLGSSFYAVHDPAAPNNRFVYEAALDRAGVETNIEDIEHLLDELTHLEELVASVRAECRAIVHDDAPLRMYLDGIC